jgi:hypothetical protein
MHRAGAAMPVAALDLARVGLNEAECRDRQAEQVGGDLREAGLVPLAVRLRAEYQRDAAIGLEADLGALARRAARGFEKAGGAEAAQPAARGPPRGAGQPFGSRYSSSCVCVARR